MVVNHEQHHWNEVPFARRHEIDLDHAEFECLIADLNKTLGAGRYKFKKEPGYPLPSSSFGSRVIFDQRLEIPNDGEEFGGEFLLERVTLNGNGKKKNGHLTNNALLNHLLTPPKNEEGKEEPPTQDQQQVLQYLQEPGVEMICLRRTRSSAQFRKAYKLHSDTFDAGYSPVTEALAILLAMDQKSCIGLPPEQIKSFQNLQGLSSTSVHFIPLTNDGNVKDHVDNLNKNADQLEIIHDIHVA